MGQSIDERVVISFVQAPPTMGWDLVSILMMSSMRMKAGVFGEEQQRNGGNERGGRTLRRRKNEKYQ